MRQRSLVSIVDDHESVPESWPDSLRQLDLPASQSARHWCTRCSVVDQTWSGPLDTR